MAMEADVERRARALADERRMMDADQHWATPGSRGSDGRPRRNSVEVARVTAQPPLTHDMVHRRYLGRRRRPARRRAAPDTRP